MNYAAHSLSLLHLSAHAILATDLQERKKGELCSTSLSLLQAVHLGAEAILASHLCTGSLELSDGAC